MGFDGCGIQVLGFRLQGLGLSVYGLGFWAEEAGFRVEGLDSFRVYGLQLQASG